MADRKPVLLVVEDDEGLQAQLKWAYEDFEVVPAIDRESAIAALRQYEPSVMTLDLGLPPDPDGTTEGFAVLEAVMELKPDTKKKGGVWYGKYVEYLDGNKKKSWRIEMRKIDE